MKYFIDTEFIDDGVTIDLISIALVAEDGREYYAQSSQVDFKKASEWVKEHVMKHLSLCPMRPTPYPNPDPIGSSWLHAIVHAPTGRCAPDCPWRTREQIRNEVYAFIAPRDGKLEEKPEFWAWCGAYDFVALCQLFGTMIEIPASWPHYMRDIQYLLDERGISDEMLPQQEETAHNALADARHIKRLWEWLAKRK